MASVNKDLKYTAFGGSNIPLPQHEKKNGDMVLSGENNPLPTQSITDIRDLEANKPDPTTVPIGATFWSVDTDPNAESVEVSNGTNWVVMV